MNEDKANDNPKKTYPQIKVCSKNKQYAKMMQSNIGGRVSEMSAVSLYVYNKVITDGDICENFHKISIDEMKHLNIFMSLAAALGADPKPLGFYRGRKAFWSAQYNKYYKYKKTLLEYSLLSELKAVDKYIYQRNTISDPYIVEILNAVIEDEREHIRIFKSLLKGL